MGKNAINITHFEILPEKENTKPKFSIVLPVRNGGEYIKDCVYSIINQNQRNFTLHILENFSTDGTLEWLNSLKDERIKVLQSKTPLSLEENWFRIAQIEKNEFFTMIGHDDLLEPNYLQIMSELIKRHPYASLYQTHFKFIGNSGGFLRHSLPMGEVLSVYDFVGHQLMRTLNSTGSGYMMRSSDFDSLGGFSQYPNLIFGDYELWIKLISQGYLAVDISECFSYREHSSASASTSVFDYQKSLFKYMVFLDCMAQKDQRLKTIIQRYGLNYLGYMLKGLIYRSIMVEKARGRDGASSMVKKFEEIEVGVMDTWGCSSLNQSRTKGLVLLDKWLIGRIIFRFAVRTKAVFVSMLQCLFK